MAQEGVRKLHATCTHTPFKNGINHTRRYTKMRIQQLFLQINKHKKSAAEAASEAVIVF